MNQHAEKIMDLIKQYNKDSDSSTSSDEKITQPNATSEKKYLEILNNDIGKIKKKKQREKLRLQFSSTLLKDIEKQIHACLGSISIPSKDTILDSMDFLIRKLTNEQESLLLLKPRVAQSLSKYIRAYLSVYKYLYRSYDVGKRYLKRVIKILGIYTDLELCASIRGTEYDSTIAERIQINYESHLAYIDRNLTLDVFLNTKRIWRRHKSILSLLMEHNLKRSPAVELSDHLFIKTLIIYKKWLYLEELPEDRERIRKSFIAFAKPKKTICLNSLYQPCLPKNEEGFPTTENIERILDMEYPIRSLFRALKKAEEQSNIISKDVIIVLSDEENNENSNDGKPPLIFVDQDDFSDSLDSITNNRITSHNDDGSNIDKSTDGNNSKRVAGQYYLRNSHKNHDSDPKTDILCDNLENNVNYSAFNGIPPLDQSVFNSLIENMNIAVSSLMSNSLKVTPNKANISEQGIYTQNISNQNKSDEITPTTAPETVCDSTSQNLTNAILENPSEELKSTSESKDLKENAKATPDQLSNHKDTNCQTTHQGLKYSPFIANIVPTSAELKLILDRQKDSAILSGVNEEKDQTDLEQESVLPPLPKQAELILSSPTNTLNETNLLSKSKQQLVLGTKKCDSTLKLSETLNESNISTKFKKPKALTEPVVQKHISPTKNINNEFLPSSSLNEEDQTNVREHLQNSPSGNSCYQICSTPKATSQSVETKSLPNKRKAPPKDEKIPEKIPKRRGRKPKAKNSPTVAPTTIEPPKDKRGRKLKPKNVIPKAKEKKKTEKRSNSCASQDFQSALTLELLALNDGNPTTILKRENYVKPLNSDNNLSGSQSDNNSSFELLCNSTPLKTYSRKTSFRNSGGTILERKTYVRPETSKNVEIQTNIDKILASTSSCLLVTSSTSDSHFDSHGQTTQEANAEQNPINEEYSNVFAPVTKVSDEKEHISSRRLSLGSERHHNDNEGDISSAPQDQVNHCTESEIQINQFEDFNQVDPLIEEDMDFDDEIFIMDFEIFDDENNIHNIESLGNDNVPVDNNSPVTTTCEISSSEPDTVNNRNPIAWGASNVEVSGDDRDNANETYASSYNYDLNMSDLDNPNTRKSARYKKKNEKA